MNKKHLAIIFLVLASSLVYLNSLNAPFIFDENTKIVKNPDIRKLSGIASKLVYPYSKNKDQIYRNDPSRPLVYLTYAVNYHYGKLNTFGYHVFNVLLHALNAVLAFLFFSMILSAVFRKDAVGPPLIAALLFAVHPINTSAVNYVMGRSDLMSTAFYLLSIILFALAVAKNRQLIYYSLAGFLLALASKQTAATLPAVIFLYDYFFISGCNLKKALERKKYHLAFWGVLAAYMLARFALLGAMGDMEAVNALWDRYHYILIQPYVILRYIAFLFVPSGLCFLHYLYLPASLLEPRVAVPYIVLAAVFVSMYFLHKKGTAFSKAALFGALWFFITLSPTSSIFPTTTPMVEYRLYLAGFGIYLAVVSLFYAANTKATRVLYAAAGICVLALGISTITRNRIYQDPVILWKEAVAMYPSNVRAYNNLGTLYYERKDYDNAVLVFNEVLKVWPAYPEAHNSLAMVYDSQGNIEQAIKEYRQALYYKPEFPEAHINIGNLFSVKKDFAGALKEYQAAQDLDPTLDSIYFNRGVMYSMQKEYVKALEEYKKALELNPGNERAKQNIAGLTNPESGSAESIEYYRELASREPGNERAHFALAMLYKDRQDFDRALDEFRKAAQINPANTDAHNSLGIIYTMRKEYDKAIKEYRQVLELDPNYLVVYLNLGNLYYVRGEYDKALKEYQKVLEKAPDNGRLHYNMGNVYHAQGNYARAVEEFQLALKFSPDNPSAFKNLGSSYYAMKNYTSALQAFENSAKFNPSDPEVSQRINTLKEMLKQ